MKIIQLIYSLQSGGAERFVVDLSNELASQGHEVHLLVFRSKSQDSTNVNFYKSLIEKNVEYHNLDIAEGFRLSAFSKTIGSIKKINPDIIHCHLNVIPYIFPLALRISKIKFFHTLHNLAPKTVGNRTQKYLNYFFYKTGRINPITISQICNESYQNFYKLDNAFTIENGRSAVKATKSFSKTKQEIKSYVKSNLTPVFIHIGRFSKQKNHDLLVTTFNRLYEEGFDFVLLVIGAGFETPQGWVLQEKACPSIKFLGEKQNVNDYLLCSDAFCLSSIYEGLPISLLEAFSAGCVPICTPAGGIPNAITDGVNGYVSNDFSKIEYFNTIRRYLNNPNEINNSVLSENFESNYSIKKCATTYVKHYRQY